MFNQEKIKINYDLKKIRNDLIRNNILAVKKYDFYSYDEINAKIFLYLKKKLYKDDMYLLKKSTKNLLRKFYEIKKKNYLKKNYD